MNARNNHNKIGQINHVMILLLILASAIVILLFVTKYISRSTMDESISACRLSVMTQAATQWGVISKTSPLDINCDKRYVNFYNTRAELGLSLENMNPISINYGDHKSKKYSELNEFIVDQVIAEEMRVCKFEFGDGKIKIFPNDKGDVLDNNRVCFVCSEINFKPGVGKKSFTNLVDFTKKTTFSEAGTNYYDYLTEETVYNNTMWGQGKMTYADASMLVKQMDVKQTFSSTYVEKYFNLSIDSSKQYVIFIQKNSPSRLDFLHIFSEKAIWIMIAPATDLNDYCDVQAS